MSAPANTDLSARAWGHKVTLHIYVPGDIKAAADASDSILDAIGSPPWAEFIGVTIDTTQYQPKGMGDG